MSIFFIADNESHIYPNMCAKFGCGPTVVSEKKGGGVRTDRQREAAALYDIYYIYICIYIIYVYIYMYIIY